MSKKIFLIAGEVSGDLIGARLIRSISELDSSIKFLGVGGENMKNAGMEQIFPLKSVAAIGIVEVLSKATSLLRKVDEVVENIIKSRADVVVTIDFSGFNDRVAKKLKKMGFNIPIIRYVAPPVWAWRGWRVKKMKNFLDLVLTLFKFEVPIFEKHGLRGVFVGHSVVEDENLKTPSAGEIEDFLNRNNFHPNNPIVCVFPGSRKTEILKHTKIFLEAMDLLVKKIPDIQIYIPTFEENVHFIKHIISNKDFISVGVSPKDKGVAMHLADGALAASGSVALELALTKTPMLIAYKVNCITAFIIKKLIKVESVNLVNILLKENIIPEFLQNRCQPQGLCDAMVNLLNNRQSQLKQLSAFEKVIPFLQCEDGVKPSQKAASEVVLLMNGR